MTALSVLRDRSASRVAEARAAGTYREEVPLASAQGAEVQVRGVRMLNFCSNDYLGLTHHPRVLAKAEDALYSRGAGLAAARFICGTQDIHLQLESDIAAFLGYEQAILVNSGFDANLGVFQALLTRNDVILSDELNHASIIDGARLSAASVARYRHADMADLEQKLIEAADAEVRIIVTDGVFSMDGAFAPLPEICDLADAHDAIVLVDDAHATGVVGATGRGSHEYWDVADRVDLITGTLGKALGGAAGGFVAGNSTLIELLKQSVRPYLFSNALPPAVVGAGLAALEVAQDEPHRLQVLAENTRYFRAELERLGYEIRPGTHPIIPVIVGDEGATMQLAQDLRDAGIFVIGLTFPVVPPGTGRIRVQISSHHSRDHMDTALGAFAQARPSLMKQEA